jgi:predicted amidophosphoribosyltransferase
MNASSTSRIVLKGSHAACPRCGAEFRWPAEWTPRFCPNCGRKNSGALEGTVPALKTLTEQIRVECRRLAADLPKYEMHPSAGTLARDILREVLKDAEVSIASGDVARMKKSLESLRNFSSK